MQTKYKFNPDELSSSLILNYLSFHKYFIKKLMLISIEWLPASDVWY